MRETPSDLNPFDTKRFTMRPNLIKTLLLSVILAVTSLAPLTIQAQTRPRRVFPSPKTDAAILSETRPRQVKAREVTEKSTQHSRSSRITINQFRDFLDRLHQLIKTYHHGSRYSPLY